ncbi:hypothetical protein G6F59_017065 [Rhizopus arrhizus]|nr:hypothetical protein G6F59_017065 [Rhizopus arrhizus]
MAHSKLLQAVEVLHQAAPPQPQAQMDRLRLLVGVVGQIEVQGLRQRLEAVAALRLHFVMPALDDQRLLRQRARVGDPAFGIPGDPVHGLPTCAGHQHRDAIGHRGRCAGHHPHRMRGIPPGGRRMPRPAKTGRH